MATSTVAVIITDWMGAIGDVLTENLPIILLTAASLFGLILIVRLAKRFLSGR